MNCRICKIKDARINKKSCLECSDKLNKIQRKYNEKMKSSGLCCHCSKPLNKYKWDCDECVTKGVEREKQKAYKRVQEGKCRECKELTMKNKKVCLRHYFQEVSGHVFQTQTKHLELMDIFTQQDGSCFYCGVILDFIRDMQIDHKNPVSRFNNEQYNIVNLVWSCKPCNQSKKDMTADEYINHCKKVALAN